MREATWWLALGLVLILEGLLPLIAPARWRQVFMRLLQWGDGQIRFMGLVGVIAGVLIVLLAR